LVVTLELTATGFSCDQNSFPCIEVSNLNRLQIFSPCNLVIDSIQTNFPSNKKRFKRNRKKVASVIEKCTMKNIFQPVDGNPIDETNRSYPSKANSDLQRL